MKKTIIIFALVFTYSLFAENYILIYMDKKQNNHLKAYGIAYRSLKKNIPGKWLLNYRGGSFLFPQQTEIINLLVEKGVSYQVINRNAYLNIKKTIFSRNMAEIDISKAPKVAIYTPPNVSPWADAVTLVMTYAEIEYTPIYDKEILRGDLSKYEWVHLHHEDFSGQYSKFWANYRNQPWFKESVITSKKTAREGGFNSVGEHKKAVARKIRKALANGLFLFAMCTATETLDIALASENLDIIPQEIDQTPLPPKFQEQIDYSKTIAFENFKIRKSPYLTSFSDIDYNQVNVIRERKETTDFVLFDFSAKIDPIATLLNQNHQKRIKGFFGQTTAFRTEVIKDGVSVLAYSIDGSVKYITGKYGKGNFTFFGGHAPEDRNHYIGDKSPDLESYKNSPGYRLILNNILFPSAKPPPKKT